MRTQYLINLVDYFARLDIQDENGFVILWSGKEAVSFEVNFQVIEVSFYIAGKSVGLDQLQRVLANRRSLSSVLAIAGEGSDKCKTGRHREEIKLRFQCAFSTRSRSADVARVGLRYA